MSVERTRKDGRVIFDTPANRVIAQQQPKNQFRIDTSLGDLAFLRSLAVQGRLRYFFGSSIGAGTPISIVPPDGETLFIYRFTVGASTGSVTLHTISNDGNVRLQLVTDTDATSLIEVTYFDSLVGDGIKAFTIANASNNASASAFGWVENTSRIRDVTN